MSDLIFRESDQQCKDVVRNEVIVDQDFHLFHRLDKPHFHTERSQSRQLFSTQPALPSRHVVIVNQRLMQLDRLFVHFGRRVHRHGQDDAAVVDQNWEWDVLEEREETAESDGGKSASNY